MNIELKQWRFQCYWIKDVIAVVLQKIKLTNVSATTDSNKNIEKLQ